MLDVMEFCFLSCYANPCSYSEKEKIKKIKLKWRREKENSAVPSTADKQRNPNASVTTHVMRCCGSCEDGDDDDRSEQQHCQQQNNNNDDKNGDAMATIVIIREMIIMMLILAEMLLIMNDNKNSNIISNNNGNDMSSIIIIMKKQCNVNIGLYQRLHKVRKKAHMYNGLLS